jgi:peptidoglycan-N-acetylglucosamine deacetylase
VGDTAGMLCAQDGLRVDQEVCTELNQTEQAISSLTGVTTRPYYRLPYGGRDTRVRTSAAQIGYRTIYWIIDTLD